MSGTTTPTPTQILTLYKDGVAIDQHYIFGTTNFPIPQGWTDTTSDPSIVVVPPPVTTIPPLEFIARLTPAEQASITQASQTVPAVMLFLLKLVAVPLVDITDPLTQAGVQAMVAAGLLTSVRATQILNLSQASP